MDGKVVGVSQQSLCETLDMAMIQYAVIENGVAARFDNRFGVTFRLEEGDGWLRNESMRLHVARADARDALLTACEAWNQNATPSTAYVDEMSIVPALAQPAIMPWDSGDALRATTRPRVVLASRYPLAATAPQLELLVMTVGFLELCQAFWEQVDAVEGIWDDEFDK